MANRSQVFVVVGCHNVFLPVALVCEFPEHVSAVVQAFDPADFVIGLDDLAVDDGVHHHNDGAAGGG
ncbi:hypothetical protein ACWEV3_01140 [Saccharopolyspora sp. NPDC003752]